MPLIRYRTGDIARISTERCPCGGVLPRLETIRGRLSNSCVISGQRVFLSGIEEAVYTDDAAVDLECAAGADSLDLTVRTLPGEKIDKEALRARLSGAVLPAGTRLSVEEETVRGFLPERSPKKRMRLREES
jgi:phenylacetate-coenzyme A ligase PaaK-like adenylate-forming protein